ncbi:hypothetical protein [Comamonas sp. C24C]
MRKEKSLRGIFHSGPDNPNFDAAAWDITCRDVFDRNLSLISKSYDAFILKCSSDFESLVSDLNASEACRHWALTWASGWGYEPPELRSTRQSVD